MQYSLSFQLLISTLDDALVGRGVDILVLVPSALRSSMIAAAGTWLTVPVVSPKGQHHLVTLWAN